MFEDEEDMVCFRAMFRCRWFRGVKDVTVVALRSPCNVDVDRHKQIKRPIGIVAASDKMGFVSVSVIIIVRQKEDGS